MGEGRKLRALVVDDEEAVQMLVMRALKQQGFDCDSAADGNQAEDWLSQAQYDVVITDLKMPNKHGHALAVDLLALKQRPVIVIHTSVIEPRLAKDLLARGVDDIVFKPFDLSLLAIKVRALVERRFPLSSEDNDESRSRAMGAVDSGDQFPHDDTVSMAHLEDKLSGMSRILPLSKAALDVYNMTGSDKWEMSQIVAAIQRDATLTAEVLRLANSSFYNTTQKDIVHLDRAVAQIGQKRIGEVALATNALTGLTATVLPWLNIGLMWKRSMAAGVAVEMIINKGNYRQAEQGMLLSVIMYPLGRFVLGTLYPKQYDAMLAHCRKTSASLSAQESQVFPVSHSEVMAHLLGTWNVPNEVRVPLKYVMADDTTLGKLSETIRLKTELIRLAIFIAENAVGQWETWDIIDLPPTMLLNQLDVRFLAEAVQRTKKYVAVLTASRTDRPGAEKPTPLSPPAREIAYCDLSGGAFDFLSVAARSMGIKLVQFPEDDLNDLPGNVLVNCVGTAPQRLAAKAKRSSSRQQLLIITDADRLEKYGSYGKAVALPASYSYLRSVCWEFSRALKQQKTSTDSELST